MKIAISATGPSLDDEVESRFGRCPYFIIADPDTMQFEARKILVLWLLAERVFPLVR